MLNSYATESSSIGHINGLLSVVQNYRKNGNFQIPAPKYIRFCNKKPEGASDRKSLMRPPELYLTMFISEQ